MENNDKQVFSYSYSAREQAEIRNIREKYISREESKLEQLRRLDQSVTRPGTIASLVVGVLSTLLLGVGMSCCMVWGDRWFLPGVIIGVIGLLGAALAYPLHIHITQKQRKRLAPQIMQLTDELLK